MVSPRRFQGVHLPEEPDFSATLTLGRLFDAWVTSNICASGRLVGDFMISHNHTYIIYHVICHMSIFVYICLKSRYEISKSTLYNFASIPPVLCPKLVADHGVREPCHVRFRWPWDHCTLDPMWADGVVWSWEIPSHHGLPSGQLT